MSEEILQKLRTELNLPQPSAAEDWTKPDDIIRWLIPHAQERAKTFLTRHWGTPAAKALFTNLTGLPVPKLEIEMTQTLKEIHEKTSTLTLKTVPGISQAYQGTRTRGFYSLDLKATEDVTVSQSRAIDVEATIDPIETLEDLYDNQREVFEFDYETYASDNGIEPVDAETMYDDGELTFTEVIGYLSSIDNADIGDLVNQPSFNIGETESYDILYEEEVDSDGYRDWEGIVEIQDLLTYIQ